MFVMLNVAVFAAVAAAQALPVAEAVQNPSMNLSVVCKSSLTALLLKDAEQCKPWSSDYGQLFNCVCSLTNVPVEDVEAVASNCPMDEIAAKFNAEMKDCALFKIVTPDNTPGLSDDSIPVPVQVANSGSSALANYYVAPRPQPSFYSLAPSSSPSDSVSTVTQYYIALPTTSTLVYSSAPAIPSTECGSKSTMMNNTNIAYGAAPKINANHAVVAVVVTLFLTLLI